MKTRWFTRIFAIAIFVSVIIFYKNILLTTIITGILAIIALIVWKSRRTLVIFVVGGIGGTILEMIAGKFGVWNYSITNVINVPWWLFIVWGSAAAVVYQIAKGYKEKKLDLR
jgi:hypothetical protein